MRRTACDGSGRPRRVSGNGPRPECRRVLAESAVAELIFAFYQVGLRGQLGGAEAEGSLFVAEGGGGVALRGFEVGVELMRAGLQGASGARDCLGRSERLVEQGAHRSGGERGLLQSGSGR